MPSAPSCSQDPSILTAWSSLCCSVCSCWPGWLFWDVTVPFPCRAHRYQGSLAKERRLVIGVLMLLEKPPTKRCGSGELVGGGQRNQGQGSGVLQLSFPGLATNSNQFDLDFMQRPCAVSSCKVPTFGGLKDAFSSWLSFFSRMQCSGWPWKAQARPCCSARSITATASAY